MAATPDHHTSKHDDKEEQMKKILTVTLTSLVLSAPLAVVTAESASAVVPRDYPNCTALNRVYPHGVGLFGARDHTSGTPVTNFKRAPKVYRLNDESDADNDKIACER